MHRSAVHRSAAPCSPTGFPRSTIGAVRLSFRVRNGTGRAPHAVAADRWAALRPPTGVAMSRSLAAPRALGAAQRGGKTRADTSGPTALGARGTLQGRPRVDAGKSSGD